EDACVCRKPRPGLLIEAQRRYGFDLAGTYFVGDSYTDLEAARRAGCRAMFVLTGLDARRYRAGEPLPDPAARVVPDLVAAAESLLAGQ
ncbi:MAG: D-glycero-beta-D-manno-heptose-1,7-bisphosphate 7-phosphatase, partial [Candidatus Hydrogenedentes bacterium]|nr:D-glycero-beta-D-manno-heptose-1,7-bisphosphate 7-phosphatase [Candidatus Hydrogenedentota bacterium]